MDRLAAVCEAIASHASRLKKVALLAEYLRALPDDDFALAVQFLSVGPVVVGSVSQTLFEVEEKSRLSIGHSILREAMQTASGWDRETLRVCYGEVGDMGEATALLLARDDGGLLSLRTAEAIYQELFRARTKRAKLDILLSTYRTYRPSTLKYFIKVITRGLRIGLMLRQVEEAVALSCGLPADAVRDANNRLGDLARVALAARHGTLKEIEARLFHPMEFMLAKPLERLEDLADATAWYVEDKYDGIRSQVHFSDGQVRIYSRGMDEITAQFPEIEAPFTRFKGSGLVDGEILAWRDGRALNFNVLQQRLARKQVKASLQLEIPVIFMAYDALLRDGRLLFHAPIEERRAVLDGLLHEPPLLISGQRLAQTRDDIDHAFQQARANGNEGLILKRKGSFYEPSKRTGAWMKVKRPYGTLDVVITSAEQGSGRRATVFSDYTFAVRSGDSFVNVGKAYSGLTDSEVKELTKILRQISTDRFGPVMIVRPEVVLEVAFDGVGKSARHKGGYALRFPRILRWRRDKTADQSDDLARVEELFNASMTR